MHIQELLVRENIEIIEQKKNSKNASDSNNSKIHQKHFNTQGIVVDFLPKNKVSCGQ